MGTKGRARKPADCHLAPLPGTPHLLLPHPPSGAHRWHRAQGTHHNDKDDRACKAPDEGLVDRDPAEVGVPVALGVQADGKA